jgi:hypothetical protein
MSGPVPSADGAAAPVQAEKICCAYPFGLHVRRLLSQTQEPGAFVDLLMHKGLYADAVRFVGHWLPERDGVWWASLCTWHMGRGRLRPDEHEALGAAVHWVWKPSPERQDTARAAAARIGFGNAAAGAARAASLAASGLSGRAVAGAVLFAVQGSPPTERARLTQQFLLLGRNIARGKMRWK